MSDWKTPHPVWIVGHRGAPRRARENTIASFDWAESFGVDAIEFDLRQTREGEAVVFHDEDIALGSQRIPVRHFTAREIERLTLSSEFGEYKIPKLEEVFHRYGRALRYVVEVKVVGRHEPRDDGAPRRHGSRAAYRVDDRCLVASFDAEFLRKMREADPEIATSFLFDHPVALPEPGRADAALPARGRDRAAPRPRHDAAARAGGGGEALGARLDRGRDGGGRAAAGGRRCLDHDERAGRGAQAARRRGAPRKSTWPCGPRPTAGPVN